MLVNEQARVSVCIVTYFSDFAMLDAAVATLRDSTVPVELVLVDNSMDNEYFGKLAAHTGVRCVQSPRNGGYGFGHNVGFASAQQHAPYHLVLNPDVEMHAGCLETLTALMDARSEIALGLPLILNRDGSVQPLNKYDPSVLDLALRRFAPAFVRRMPWAKRRIAYFVRMHIGYEAPSEVPYASGCFMLFRRSVYDAIGGFDERFFMYFEDADISRRARTQGLVYFTPEARITHGWQRGSHTSTRLMLATLASAYRYFCKWGLKLA